MSLAFVNNHATTPGHKDAIWALQWTAKNHAITASADGGVAQWDATSGQQIRSLPPHTLGIVSLSVPPVGEYALYNTLEGMTGLWDLSSGDVVGKWESYKRKGEDEPAWQVSLHPNNQTYASTGGSGNVVIHTALPSDGSESSFGTPTTTLKSGRSRFGMCVKHSPDGSRVAMASEAGTISLFDIKSESLITSYHSHAMCVRTLAWSPDSSLLVSGSDDRRLTLHDVRSATSTTSSKGGAVTQMTGHTSWVLSASISPDGKHLLSGSSDKSMRIYDLSSPRTAVWSSGVEGGEVWGVCWRPMNVGGVSTAGGAFVSGSEDGVARFWRAAGSAA